MAQRDAPMRRWIVKAQRLNLISPQEAWLLNALSAAADQMPTGQMALPESLYPAAARIALHERTIGERKQ